MAGYLDASANKGDPQLRSALGAIIHRISASLPELEEPIKMYLAGGMAVNFYTGYRPTVDVDASFSHRLILPRAEDLVVSYTGSDGKPKLIYFDMNYNTSFALTHPDFEKDSYRVGGGEFQDPKIHLYVVAPIDLALSKVSRFEENDREDIAELARHNLIDPTALVDRAGVAMDYYIGDPSMLRLNLKEAVDIIHAAKTESKGKTEG
jgi:hypothetical protein